ncbi:hypothetical protein UQW22_09845 [Isoptericola halotolerans]|uniref:hypothetical protein n=1 Tax=Isoptericola halotolerans TaxID=300560 RepID=UPI00388E7EAF
MTEYRGLFVRPDASQGTTPVEARKSLAGMFSQLADGSPRAGLLAPAQVTGTGGWAYSVPAFAVVLSRGSSDGVVLTGNDGTISVPTDPAPASGSRVDVVYVLHRDVDNGDPDSGVEVGVAIGDVSGTPSAPSIPTGALALAGAIVSASDLSTFDSQIEQTSTYTSVAGGDLHVPFALAEFSTRIPDPVDGMRVWSDADGILYVRVGGAWETAHQAEDPWHDLAPLYENGWGGTGRYRRDSAGNLHVQARLTTVGTSSTGANPAFTLPEGYRHDLGTFMRLPLGTNSLSSNASGYFYPASGSGTPGVVAISHNDPGYVVINEVISLL